MGKKSLTKSTSKKKATKKKGTTKSDSAKNDTAQTKTGKTASKKPGAAKKPTLKSLRKKDFGTWTPAAAFAPKPETGAYTAPPAVETTDKEAVQKLRDLLKKQFDTAKPAKKTAAKTSKKEAKPASPKKPAKKAAPKKAPSVKELIKKQFDTTWAPETLFTPEPSEAHFSAPPAIDTNNAEETTQIKTLLGKTFDLTATQPPAPEKESEPAKAKETVAPEKETAAAEKKEKEQTAAEPEARPAAEKPKTEKKETAEKQKATAPAKSGKPAPKASAKGEKAKHPTQPPSGDGGEPPIPPPPGGGPQEPREPMSNALKILIISLSAIFACIILASALNSSKYYIKPGDAGVEIWKGDFSPRGKEKLVTLEDTTMPPDDGEGAVSKQKAYSLPFDYYMQRAEKLSEKDGSPDFEAIREELKKAKKYAVTNKQMQKVKNRLNHIEFTFLLNKANMAAGQDSAEGYEKALEYLRQARELTATPSQREMVAKQIREVQEARKNEEKKPDRDSSANH